MTQTNALRTPGDILRAMADMRAGYTSNQLIDLQVATLRQAAQIFDGDEDSLTGLAPSWTWDQVPEVLAAASKATEAATSAALEPQCRPGLEPDALTDRQRKGIEEILTEARDVYGIDAKLHELAFDFDDESRPGRGRHVRFLFADSDRVLGGGLDVYGREWMCVGDVDWTHSSSDEECRCGLGDCALQDEDDLDADGSTAPATVPGRP